MDRSDRKIMSLITKRLKFNNIQNPCDTIAIFKFYSRFKEIIPDVRSHLEELSCYDIPDWRKREMIQELKDIE